MATMTYQNGVNVLPSIGDLAEVFNGLVVTGSNATKVVLENAFGKITLTADVSSQFAFGSYGEYPASGSIASVSVQVYSAAGTLVNFATSAYGASPIAVTSVLSPYYYGYGISFSADTLFAQADTINGTAAADWMLGRGGNDTLNGAAGDDTLDGGYGNDSMAGGGGGLRRDGAGWAQLRGQRDRGAQLDRAGRRHGDPVAPRRGLREGNSAGG